jgi:hypothetical protein
LEGNARVRLTGDAFAQGLRDAGFSDAGLAGQQHHLRLAGLGGLPAARQ